MTKINEMIDWMVEAGGTLTSLELEDCKKYDGDTIQIVVARGTSAAALKKWFESEDG